MVDAAHDLRAEHVRQAQIEQHDVRLRLLGEGDRFAPCAGVAGESDPGRALDEVADAVEHDRMVVCDENADRALHRGQPGTQARTVTPPSSFPPTVR